MATVKGIILLLCIPFLLVTIVASGTVNVHGNSDQLQNDILMAGGPESRSLVPGVESSTGRLLPFILPFLFIAPVFAFIIPIIVIGFIVTIALLGIQLYSAIAVGGLGSAVNLAGLLGISGGRELKSRSGSSVINLTSKVMKSEDDVKAVTRGLAKSGQVKGNKI